MGTSQYKKQPTTHLAAGLLFTMLYNSVALLNCGIPLFGCTLHLQLHATLGAGTGGDPSHRHAANMLPCAECASIASSSSSACEPCALAACASSA